MIPFDELYVRTKFAVAVRPGTVYVTLCEAVWVQVVVPPVVVPHVVVQPVVVQPVVVHPVVVPPVVAGIGVTVFEFAEATLFPCAFTATTLNVYGVPFVKPFTVIGDDVPDARTEPREFLTL